MFQTALTMPLTALNSRLFRRRCQTTAVPNSADSRANKKTQPPVRLLHRGESVSRGVAFAVALNSAVSLAQIVPSHRRAASRDADSVPNCADAMNSLSSSLQVPVRCLHRAPA